MAANAALKMEHDTGAFFAEQAVDLFVASPMSPYSDAEYAASRESLIALVAELKRRFGFEKVFCPGIVVSSAASFATSYDSVAEDLAALRSASHFVLHYVNAVKSSAIFEAGIAYQLGLPSVYIVRKRADLPYLLRELEQYEHTQNGPVGARVRIVEVGDAADSVSALVTDDWFPAIT